MITLDLALRNARLQVIVDRLEGGSLKLYDGRRPKTGGPGTTLLADVKLGHPCGVVQGAVLTMDSFQRAKGLAMGVATWARFEDIRGKGAIDASVGIIKEDGTCDADVAMEGTTAIATGQPVDIEAAVLTEPGE
jgi:hypothetical protein